MSWGPAAQKCVFTPDPDETFQGYPATRFRYQIAAGEYAHKLILSGLDFAPDRFALSVQGCGDPDVRVLARKHRQRPEWLLTAWAAGGADRDATVTIPDLGTVTLHARACGSVYQATLEEDKPSLRLVDEDRMLPTARL